MLYVQFSDSVSTWSSEFGYSVTVNCLGFIIVYATPRRARTPKLAIFHYE